MPFKPLDEGRVGLYSCGPTVYDYAHLGNMRAYLFVDTLRRVLEYRGFRVKHVMNVTDVGHLTDDGDQGEDKLEVGAAREKKSAWDVAKFFEAAFFRDLNLLNVESPTVTPRATEHIEEQIALICELERRGFTYRISEGIYFDTAKLPDYGKLAHLNEQELQAGARVEVNQEKLHARDFALWKFSPKESQRQMEWSSPWGKGFPGWHIECSAMSVKYLGQPFDIHTGGIDHINIHHTNEIAQTEAATGKTLANYWLHVEYLQQDGGKMAKSAGAFIRLDDIMARGYEPLAFRFFALGTHYRHPLNFTWEGLDAAAKGLKNLREHVMRLEGEPTQILAELEDPFMRAISDDLNTPQALGILQETLKNNQLDDGTKLAAIEAWDKVFGLKLMDGRTLLIPQHIQDLFEKYQVARKERDFSSSDQLRAELAKNGFHVEDNSAGESRIIPGK